MKKNFIINYATIFALGLVVAGCSHNEIEYNDSNNEMQEQAKSNFPVSDIDPNQDWNTSTTRSATVNIGGEPYNSYDIYLFTQMPTSGVATPTVATQKEVRGGRTLQFTFDIAKGQTELYVGRNSESGFVVKQVSLASDSTYKADFNLVSDASTRAFADKKDEMTGNPFESVTAPYTNDFKTSVPSGAKKNATNSNSSGYSDTADNIEITSGTYKLNYWSGGVKKLYINGDVTLSADASNPEKLTTIYVLPNSKLTLNGYVSNANPGVNIYVSEDATLTMGAKQKSLSQGGTRNTGKIDEWGNAIYVNNEINIYNRGTLNLGSTELGNGSMIYNEGTLNADSITFNSGAARTYRGMLINKGKVIVKNDVTMTSNCSLLNDCYMSVGGSVTANQSSIWFVNTGNLTVAENMKVTAGNNTFYNGCQIKVGGTLDLDNGSGYAAFNILSDGSFYCKDLVMSNNKIVLGARSSVTVTGTSTFKRHGDGIFQGLDASSITSDADRPYANLGTIQFVKGSDNTLSGNKDLQANGNMILTATNLQEALKIEPWQSAKAVVLGEGVVTTVPEGFAVNANLDEDAACLQYTPVPYTPDTESTNYAYAFEDMKLGDNSDYDFNDVVLYVTTPDADGNVNVTLKAAGATRQIAVKHKSTDGIVTTLWEDVHTALGVDAGTIVNTGTGNESSETPTYSNFHVGSLNTNGDFYILVDGITEVHIPQYTTGFNNGDAPYAIMVTKTNWKWPNEYIRITDAYDGFAEWAKNALNNSEWYDVTPITNVYSK